MTSEIRTNSLKSRAGLSTVTLTDSGPIFSGITTFLDNSIFNVGNINATGVVTATSFVGSGANLTGISGGVSGIDTTGQSHLKLLFVNAGVVTFTNTSNPTPSATLPSGTGGHIYSFDNSLNIVGGSGVGGGGLVFQEGGFTRWRIASGHFRPHSDSTVDIGTNTVRVRNGYFDTLDVTDLKLPDGNSNGLYIGGSDDLHLFHNGADSYVQNDTGNLNFTNKNNNNIIFRTTNSETERLRIDSSGRILIGTTQYTTNKGVVIYGESGRGADVVFQNANTGTGTGNNGFYVGNGTGAASYVWNYENADLYFATNNTERLRIDNLGKIIHSANGGDNQYISKRTGVAGSNGDYFFQLFANNNGDTTVGSIGIHRDTANDDSRMVFHTRNSGGSNQERLRIASNGQATFTGNKVRIDGGTTARSIDVETTHGSGGEIASFQNNNSGNYGGLVISGGEIDRECRLEAAWGSGFMTFWADNAERMRINSGGDVFIGTTTINPGIGNYQTPGTMIRAAAGDYIAVSRQQGCPLFLNRDDNTGTLVSLRYNATERGTIQTDGSIVAYNTSSDYRLKENVVALTGAIDRLKTLSPKRFNFKEFPSKTVDGFLAHEVTAVPEAITGTKDEVATEDNVERSIKKGDPIYQGMDQSKLVPLLTAALQEAITKIEKLEQDNITLLVRVTNLEGN